MNCSRNLNPLILSILLFVPAAAKNQVSWIEDLSLAQQTAAARNQLLLLHFTADWCGPCQRLEKHVFSEPSFGFALNSEFVPCKINVTQHPELATRFGVAEWPTDLLLTPDGKEVHRMTSPQAVEPYLNALRTANWHFRNSMTSPQLAASPMPPQQPQPPSSQLSGELARQLAERFGGARTAEIQQAQYMQLEPPRSTFPQAASQPTNQIPMQAPSSPQTTPAAAGRQMAPGYPPPQDSPQAWQHANSGPTAANRTVSSTPSLNDRAPQGGLPATMPSHPGPSMAGTASADRPVQCGEQMVLNQYATGYEAKSPIDSKPSANSTGDSSPRVASNYEPKPSSAASAATPANYEKSQPVVPAAQLHNPTPTSADIRLGLDGYCPVTLIQENQWLPGDKRWGAKHRGVVYLFQTAAAQQVFLSDPDRFSPVLAGYDPVVFCDQGDYAAGQRAHGIRYRDLIILFASEESLEKFSSAPEPYMTRIAQALGPTVARR